MSGSKVGKGMSGYKLVVVYGVGIVGMGDIAGSNMGVGVRKGFGVFITLGTGMGGETSDFMVLLRVIMKIL